MVSRLRAKHTRLLEQYRGTKVKHPLLCLKCGNKWSATLGVDRGSCPKCGRMRSIAASMLKPKDVHARLAKVGLRLTEKYSGIKKMHRIKCIKCAYEWDTMLVSSVCCGCGCPKCNRQAPTLLPTELVRTKLKELNFTLISPYLGRHHWHTLKCKSGHTWGTKGNLLGIRSCTRCTLQDRRHLIQQKLKGFGIELLSTDANTRTKLTLCCSNCNHVWTAKWYVKVCPECGPTGMISESATRELLEKLTHHKFGKKQLEWARENGKMPLELDGYNQVLQMAFEYQGQQHYRPVDFGSGRKQAIEKLRRQQLNDNRKRFLCRYHGVFLIVVPYWIKDLKAFLLDKLRKYCVRTGKNFACLRTVI